MLDKNNKEITEGMFLQIIGCKVKNDNGIYIVDRKYEGREEFCLYKVNQSGEIAKTKYNIYFLDEKHDKDKQITIISREELKQAAKEVKDHLNNRTAAEIVYTFSVAENQTLQGLQEGQAIKFIKRIQLRGCMNSYSGTFIITKIENDRYRLHLLGAKGDKIADNANGFYQFTPIHLNFKADTMQQLFNENYIEILNRIESTKGEIKQEKQKIEVEQEQQTTVQEELTEQEKENASLCYNCKNFNSNNNYSCKGMEAIYTGCVCYNIDAKLPTIEIPTEQPKTEPKEEKTEQQEIQTIQNEKQPTEQQTVEPDKEKEPIKITVKYYPINEASAKTAKTINSFYDYKPNEATEMYRVNINSYYEIAKQKAEQNPDKAEQIQNLLDRYSKKYADWLNKNYSIECMCPSVMICGGGNFTVRKKEKQNKARDRHMQLYNDEILTLANKIENMNTSAEREQIKSNDENAIEKLQAKVKELTADLERYKAMNKHYRKYKTMLGFEGLTEEQAKNIDESIKKAYTWDQQPVPSFDLTSVRNKIKTAEGRIAEIKRLKETAEQHTENQEQQYKSDVCKVVENAELMRIQLLFDGIPSENIRSILKSNGFRWSPSNKAWQRQLTDNARYTTKKVLEQISA